MPAVRYCVPTVLGTQNGWRITAGFRGLRTIARGNQSEYHEGKDPVPYHILTAQKIPVSRTAATAKASAT